MNAIDVTERLDFACALARRAGQRALGYAADIGALDVRSKGVQDMATEADDAVERLVRDAVEATYPDDGFLGEESCELFRPDASRGTWVVDPIDGTQPFICCLSTWCVSLSWFAEGRVRLGVIYDPNRDELFSAALDQGATLNGQAMRASSATGLDQGLVGIGHSNRVTTDDTLDPMRRLLDANGMFHRCGSGALTLAHVAAGRLIGYYEPHMNAWDAIAGDLLVREAGGRTNEPVRDVNDLLTGAPMLAAAPAVWPALQSIIKGSA
ncbi:inositol monophosphatase [Marinihelvus fidelis]|uniref:Inositol monophosphatase n=1 Tax=Marinihelvus fidelis TaxID=2613842 RepID=A0A5N0TAB4_9GAMM|nr:inositol monophosphatase [Marinihelvus fidelis]KAA9131628.1 inositol monophosphatase [Marinihelvus fidelis]